MIRVYAESVAIVFAFVIAAILLSKALETPADPYVVVKPRVVDMGDEIAKRKDAVYDARMDQ